jgi:putative ATP-dependent endonuclease of the OLD family
MSILVKEVRINNFRSHKDTKVELEPLTLLVGQNNSGKTTFLRALAIALNSDRKFINKDDLFINSDGANESGNQIIIDINIKPNTKDNKFDDKWLMAFGTDINSDTAGNDFLAYRTLIDFKLGNLDAQIKRYVITDWDSGNADTTTELTAKTSCIPLFFIDAQRDLQEDIKTATSYFGRLAKQIAYNKKDLGEIEKALEKINDASVKKSQVLQHLKKNLEELNKTVQNKGKGVEITPFPKKIRDLHKGLKVHFQDGESDSFSLEYHGMGTRSWASLLAFKAFIDWETNLNEEANEPFHPVLALEEPEAHLHPNAQRQLYNQLSTISGQKIISTHSPYIAAQAELKELRHFRKYSDETEVSSLAIDKFSTEEQRRIRREIIDTKGELLFSTVVILSEGETEEQALPIFARKHWGTTHFETGTTFVGCGGDNYKAFIQLFSAFNIKWFIFSDYDNDTVRSRLKAALKAIGIQDPPETVNDVILLNKGFEKYLIDDGYQDELKKSILLYDKAKYEPTYANDKHKAAKEPEVKAQIQSIMDLDDTNLLIELEKFKAKLSPIYSELIVAPGNIKIFPSKLTELFTKIDAFLNATRQ